jgi:hypothetical protein
VRVRRRLRLLWASLARVQRRIGRVVHPSRLLASLFLLGALAAAILLLTAVVRQDAVKAPVLRVGTGSTTTIPAAHPPTTTTPGHATPRPVAAPKHAPSARSVPVGQTVPLGVYAGPGAPAAAAVFSADAGAPVPYAFDYLDGHDWQSLSNPQWFVQRWSGSGFRMIWGVPMLTDLGTGTTLAVGATGLYDVYFTELAYTLVTHGLGNSVILLGWDPQVTDAPWAVATPADAANYVAYWRQIVTSMRSVAGQQFQFAWDSAPGEAAVSPASLYPGNAYVDVVATDAFDMGGVVVSLGWSGFAASPYGPNWFAGFAARHNKPLMIAKWGVVPREQSGGGDSAAFVRQFLLWAAHRHLFAAVTWDYGPWAVTGGSFPQAAATLRSVAAAGVVPPLGRGIDT